MTDSERLKNMFYLAFDLGVNSQTRGALFRVEVEALADAAWAKYILCFPPAIDDAGPVVVLAGPGVRVFPNYTCPDCGVTGDAIAPPGETEPRCMACMEVE